MMNKKKNAVIDRKKQKRNQYDERWEMLYDYYKIMDIKHKKTITK